MCLYKKILLNPKYLPNKKNEYNPPKLTDERFRYIEAECGKCFECRKKRSREWSIRLGEELKNNFGYFITLTIDEENLRILTREAGYKNIYKNENGVAKLALRRMLERIRKETGKSARHWVVTELGEKNDRIHMHGIFIGQRAAELVKKHWKYGNIYVGTYANMKTTNYITKYMTKMDVKHRWFTGRVFTSAGIGREYIDKKRIRNRYRGKDTKDTYMCENGQEIAMPTYYKNKLYTEEEREMIWGFKQEDPMEWISGTRIYKKDEKLKKELIEYNRKIQKETHFDNPREWKEKSKENKLSRKREAYIKIYKEILRDEKKTGVKRKSVSINYKIQKEKEELYRKYQKYIIPMQEKKKSSNNQLKLFKNEIFQ